jgi:hypothetical protein
MAGRSDAEGGVVLAVAASLPDLLIRARSFLRISDENRCQVVAGAWMHG